MPNLQAIMTNTSMISPGSTKVATITAITTTLFGIFLKCDYLVHLPRYLLIGRSSKE